MTSTELTIVRTEAAKTLTYLGHPVRVTIFHHDRKSLGLRTIRREYLDDNGDYLAGTVTEATVEGDGRTPDMITHTAEHIISRPVDPYYPATGAMSQSVYSRAASLDDYADTLDRMLDQTRDLPELVQFRDAIRAAAAFGRAAGKAMNRQQADAKRAAKGGN